MLTSNDFWVGAAVGVILYYLYSNHASKGKGGM